jgi:hypothetical protein
MKQLHVKFVSLSQDSLELQKRGEGALEVKYRQTPIQETSSIKSEKSIIKFVSEGVVFAGTDDQT